MGENTLEILQELGYSTGDIDQFKTNAIVEQTALPSSKL
jgi:hypothetical protein